MTQRKAFEAWVKVNRKNLDLNYAYDAAGQYHYDGYIYADTQDEFELWQAAWDAALEQSQDAKRYRWLRATTNWVSSKGERIDVRNMPELWDESIDAAIKMNGENHEHV